MKVTGNPGVLRDTPALPAACHGHSSFPSVSPPLPPKSQLTAPLALPWIQAHPWPRQTSLQWAARSGADTVLTLAWFFQCLATVVPHG